MKDLSRFEYLLGSPDVVDLRKVYRNFLLDKATPCLRKHLDLDKKSLRSYFSIDTPNYIPRTIPFKPQSPDTPKVLISAEVTPMQTISLLRNICKQYLNQFSLKHPEEFIKYCFNTDVKPTKTHEFSCKKFAMLLDDTFLHLGLIDDNLDVRELAQYVKKHEHGR